MHLVEDLNPGHKDAAHCSIKYMQQPDNVSILIYKQNMIM
jgi:hypothetical protein